MNKWLCIILICLSQFSCTGKNNIKLISRKELIPLLVDLNIADAISSSPITTSQIGPIDSGRFYGSIFLKHKHTKLELDKTIDYYSGKPKILSVIYDEVFAELNKRSEKFKSDNLKFSFKFRILIWAFQKPINIDGNSVNYLDPFDIRIDSIGNYLIIATTRLGKKDQSLNPRISAYFYDSINDNFKNRVYFKDFPMTKSDFVRQYQLSMEVKDTSLLHLHIIIPKYDSIVAGSYKDFQLSEINVYRLRTTSDQK